MKYLPGKTLLLYRLEKITNFFYWRGDSSQIIFYCLACFVLCYIFTKLCKRPSKMGLQVADPHRGHSWEETDFIYSKPTYCNWCKMPVLRGSYCSTCGLCVHDNCLDAANKKHACKVVVLSRRNSMKHHWIRGNLPLTSICDVCRTHCGTEPRLCDLRCVWCQRTIHENCMKTLSRDCNFGKFQSMILPPYCITVKYERWNSAYSRYVVREVHPPKFKKWSPLLVLANRKSGEGEGDRLLKAFKQYLNPVQVIPLLF